jgi:hypothetical protein
MIHKVAVELRKKKWLLFTNKDRGTNFNKSSIENLIEIPSVCSEMKFVGD